MKTTAQSLDCPILRRANQLGSELKRSLRRLEKTLSACRECSQSADCEASQLVQEAVERAAREVLDELGA